MTLLRPRKGDKQHAEFEEMFKDVEEEPEKSHKQEVPKVGEEEVGVKKPQQEMHGIVCC